MLKNKEARADDNIKLKSVELVKSAKCYKSVVVRSNFGPSPLVITILRLQKPQVASLSLLQVCFLCCLLYVQRS